MEATQLLEDNSLLDEEDEASPNRVYGYIYRLDDPSSKFPIHHGVTKIGRDPDQCQIVFSNKSMSRVHAILEVETEEHITICDNKSLNKTYRNGMQLKPGVRYMLEAKALLTFGEVELGFEAEPKESKPGKDADIFQKDTQVFQQETQAINESSSGIFGKDTQVIGGTPSNIFNEDTQVVGGSIFDVQTQVVTDSLQDKNQEEVIEENVQLTVNFEAQVVEKSGEDKQKQICTMSVANISGNHELLGDLLEHVASDSEVIRNDSIDGEKKEAEQSEEMHGTEKLNGSGQEERKQSLVEEDDASFFLPTQTIAEEVNEKSLNEENEESFFLPTQSIAEEISSALKAGPETNGSRPDVDADVDSNLSEDLLADVEADDDGRTEEDNIRNVEEVSAQIKEIATQNQEESALHSTMMNESKVKDVSTIQINETMDLSHDGEIATQLDEGIESGNEKNVTKDTIILSPGSETEGRKSAIGTPATYESGQFTKFDSPSGIEEIYESGHSTKFDSPSDKEAAGKSGESPGVMNLVKKFEDLRNKPSDETSPLVEDVKVKNFDDLRKRFSDEATPSDFVQSSPEQGNDRTDTERSDHVYVGGVKGLKMKFELKKSSEVEQKTEDSLPQSTVIADDDGILKNVKARTFSPQNQEHLTPLVPNDEEKMDTEENRDEGIIEQVVRKNDSYSQNQNQEISSVLHNETKMDTEENRDEGIVEQVVQKYDIDWPDQEQQTPSVPNNETEMSTNNTDLQKQEQKTPSMQSDEEKMDIEENPRDLTFEQVVENNDTDSEKSYVEEEAIFSEASEPALEVTKQRKSDIEDSDEEVSPAVEPSDIDELHDTPDLPNTQALLEGLSGTHDLNTNYVTSKNLESTSIKTTEENKSIPYQNGELQPIIEEGPIDTSEEEITSRADAERALHIMKSELESDDGGKKSEIHSEAEMIEASDGNFDPTSDKAASVSSSTGSDSPPTKRRKDHNAQPRKSTRSSSRIADSIKRKSQTYQNKNDSDDDVIEASNGNVGLMPDKASIAYTSKAPESPLMKPQPVLVEPRMSTRSTSSSVKRKSQTSQNKNDRSVETAIERESTDSRMSCRKHEKPKVMFSGYEDEHDQKIVDSLGGTITSDMGECTVLVTDQIRRTTKFMCMVGKGIPIVSPMWLKHSASAKTFLDPWLHIVDDGESERKFGFNLRTSLRIASKAHILSGYKVFATRSVIPPPSELKEMVISSGGDWLKTMPRNATDNFIIVTCEKDKHLVKKFAGQAHIVDQEFLLLGILRQRLNFKTHQILF